MINLLTLNQYRRHDLEIMTYQASECNSEYSGVFEIPSKIDNKKLRIIASAWPHSGWDHVSVSREKRVPNWYEMEQIARMFFKSDEVAMQLHVPVSDHISIATHCLHLWRPHSPVSIPLPPKEYV